MILTDVQLAALVLQNEGQPGEVQAAATGAMQAPGALPGAAGGRSGAGDRQSTSLEGSPSIDSHRSALQVPLLDRCTAV